MSEVEEARGLAGRHVLVTGAASGIGKACALRAAHAGARVAVADIDLASAEHCVTDIRAADGDAFAIEVDVADDATVRAAVDTAVGEVGVLHALIHAAGGTADAQPAALLDLDTEGFERIVRFNLVGTLP